MEHNDGDAPPSKRPNVLQLPPRRFDSDGWVQHCVSDVLSFEGIPADEINRAIVESSFQNDGLQDVAVVVVDPWSTPPGDDEQADLESSFVPEETTRVSESRARDLMAAHRRESRRIAARPTTPVKMVAFPVRIGILASCVTDDVRTKATELIDYDTERSGRFKKLQEALKDCRGSSGEEFNKILNDMRRIGREIDEGRVLAQYESLFDETLGTMNIEQVGVISNRRLDAEQQKMADYAHVYLEQSKAFMRDYRRLLGPEYGRKFLDAMRSPAHQALILVYNTESYKSWLNWITASNGTREKNQDRRVARNHMFTVESSRRRAASRAAGSEGRFDEGQHPRRLVVPFFMQKSELPNFIVDVSTKRLAVVQPAVDVEKKSDD
jgi:hypothetical protein